MIACIYNKPRDLAITSIEYAQQAITSIDRPKKMIIKFQESITSYRIDYTKVKNK